VGAPLAQLGEGATAVVHGVTDEVPEILKHLSAIGLRPGTTIHVREKAPLGGPITIDVGDERHAISLELARMVTVIGPS
ncbi:MAG: FeoA family protein, partial [Vulcanimicrobiaceae bacterium]